MYCYWFKFYFLYILYLFYKKNGILKCIIFDIFNVEKKIVYVFK